MNKVELVGRLTKDPDVKVGGNTGTTIASFSVACDRRTKEGGADFINCVAFGKTAEFIEKYFHKGMRIGLVGSINTGSYKNKDGKTVYTTNVLASEVEFVESKNAASEQPAPKKNDGFMDVPDGSDEEMPFN